MVIEKIDHIGIRVANIKRSIEFYKKLGFKVLKRSQLDKVVIMKNYTDVEINLIYNANNPEGDHNILMDIETKYPGFTHTALRVSSISETIKSLKAKNIKITQGPVSFGETGQISVFVRDPDRNTLELRGHAEEKERIEGRDLYDPKE